MKIAILYVGIIRPSRESFLQNKANLINSIGPGHEITTCLFSWKYPESIEVLNNKDVDICVLKDEKDYDDKLPATSGEQQDRRKNHWKMFITSKEFIETIANNDNYDILIYSRPDLNTVLHPGRAEEWFKETCYNVPTLSSVGAVCEGCNDQFGIATPKNMLGAWNYGDMQGLFELLPIDSSIPE